MPVYQIDYSLPVGNRAQMRQDLISCFLQETHGIGKGDLASRYQYNVEKYGNYGIYLRRPTQLNKGFDFTVNVSGMFFKKTRKYSNPSHNDIIAALNCCKEMYPNEYEKVKNAIVNVYNCANADLSGIRAGFTDCDGEERPIQIIILAIKWLFMEQDCAYWNYSGRAMLFGELKNRGLI